jgi:hypothetical protein
MAKVTVDGNADDRYAGDLAPEASFADANTLIYNVFEVAPGAGDISFPSIHRFTLSTGTDAAIATSAFSFAVRHDGAIAYFRFPDPDVRKGVVPVGSINVATSASGPSLDANSTTWTTAPDHYVVAAWAGDTLIAYRENDGGTRDVLALDGPSQVRTLASGAQIVAISPDGTEVMLTGQSAGSSIPGTVEVVRVADGAVVASAAVSTLAANGASLGSIGNTGDWIGNLVLADTGAGLALLRIDSTITVDRVIGTAMSEPQFVSNDSTRFIGWRVALAAENATPSSLYEVEECRLNPVGDLHCSLEVQTPEPVRPVRSASRPM